MNPVPVFQCGVCKKIHSTESSAKECCDKRTTEEKLKDELHSLLCRSDYSAGDQCVYGFDPVLVPASRGTHIVWRDMARRILAGAKDAGISAEHCLQVVKLLPY